MTETHLHKTPDYSIIDSLLYKNMKSNHIRLLTATAIIGILGYSITTWLKWKGLATAAISYNILLKTGLSAVVILLFTLWVVRFYGPKIWTKWFVVTNVLAIMTIFRMAPTDAPESHAMFYLAIVLSLFYFDRLLIAYCTILCILLDILLMHFYPLLIPEGTFVGTLLMRYFFYVCFAISASIGSSTVKEMLNAASTIKDDNVRLQAENQMNIRTDQLRKEFIAAVSHELKSPLSLIEGYTEGLKDGIVSGKDSEIFADIIIEEVHKMEQLVSDMLEVSKLELDFHKPKIAHFPINIMLEQIIFKYAKILEENGIKIKKKIPGNTIIALGDPFMIERVLDNFIDNAIRHTKTQGSISLETQIGLNKIKIEVRNKGSLINEKDLTKIWAPFYRSEWSRSREHGGTGLGLSIASTILKLHNSEYGVYNDVNGVCFYFFLPIVLIPNIGTFPPPSP